MYFIPFLGRSCADYKQTSWSLKFPAQLHRCTKGLNWSPNLENDSQLSALSTIVAQHQRNLWNSALTTVAVRGNEAWSGHGTWNLGAQCPKGHPMWPWRLHQMRPRCRTCSYNWERWCPIISGTCLNDTQSHQHCRAQDWYCRRDLLRLSRAHPAAAVENSRYSVSRHGNRDRTNIDRSRQIEECKRLGDEQKSPDQMYHHSSVADRESHRIYFRRSITNESF